MSDIVSVVLGVIIAVGGIWVVGASLFALYDWATKHRTPESTVETDDDIDHRFY